MEKNVFSNPETAILTGSLYFEKLLDIILATEGIKEGRTSYENINKLKSFGIINYETKKKFHRAKDLRNTGVHQIPDEKKAFQLCALLFHISVWFYEKYGNDPSFKKPSFDRSLVTEKDKEANANSNLIDLPKSNMGQIGDFVDDEQKSVLNGEGPYQQEDRIVIEASVEGKTDKYKFSKTNGSYLLTELSKLKKSSKESIEDSKGFKNNFKKYMHVDRDIQVILSKKLEELRDKDSSQLILLAGSVGDGKSHLLSYMKYKHPNLMKNFKIHNDATESFDPSLTAIETLIKVLEPFSDENINKSDTKLILAINLGILSNLMEDISIKSNFSQLCELLDNLNIFDNSTVTNNITEDFLTIINFTDYQLYELTEEGVKSDFISNLLNRVTKVSDENFFYEAYNMDKQLNIKSPIIYNFEMLMNDDVKEIIIQYLLKSIIKNKKIISTRELLNFIYEIIVPAKFVSYSNMDDVSEYIGDLLPNLLFNTQNRSDILKDLSLLSPANVRSEIIDEFIISLNTLKIESVLSKYFEDYEEFNFFKEFLIKDIYSENKLKQKIIKDSLIYYVLFFGNDKIKLAFSDEFYKEYLKFLYYSNYDSRKLRKLFTKVRKSILEWRGTTKRDYIVIDELPSFTISKRVLIDFKPNMTPKIEVKNNFKNNIQFNVHINDDFCDGEFCSGESCKEHKCVKLNIDYLLFESINKINKGYKPNKNEKENLIIFNDFIDEILSKKGDNELLISYSPNTKLFKFKRLSGNYYTLEGD